jgi:hypothetical protein
LAWLLWLDRPKVLSTLVPPGGPGLFGSWSPWAWLGIEQTRQALDCNTAPIRSPTNLNSRSYLARVIPYIYIHKRPNPNTGMKSTVSTELDPSSRRRDVNERPEQKFKVIWSGPLSPSRGPKAARSGKSRRCFTRLHRLRGSVGDGATRDAIGRASRNPAPE